MKRTVQLIIILVVFLTASIASVAQVSSSQRNNPNRGRSGKSVQRFQGNQQELIQALPYEDPSAEEVAAIDWMRAEERLARDVYLALYTKWNLPIFWNIASSEQRHMDAIGALFQKYGLDLPEPENTGEFSQQKLQNLYDQLVDEGTNSIEQAFYVGATIEDLDILDLKELLDSDEVNNVDLTTVFKHLLAGSENHMRAFNRQLTASGIGYEAQFISDDELVEILSISSERGPRGSRSQKRAGKQDGSGDGNNKRLGDGNGLGTGSCPYGN